MTLGELFESGIVIQGYRIIQCWETEDGPTIYYQGETHGDIEPLYDREISYMFPFQSATNGPGICIELKEH